MLELKSKWREWKDNVTGETKKYRTYYVLYNGIELQLKPKDYAVAQILNQVFNLLELDNK